ncbi:MAG: mechanosensitive ion channel domain-containing protein [Sulfitobacter sp.]
MEYLDVIKRTLAAIVLTLFCITLTLAPASAQQSQSETTDQSTSSSDTLETLLDTLKDDDARAALISELETLAQANTSTEVVDEVLTETSETVSIGRRIALFTQDVVQQASDRITSLWTNLNSGTNVFDGLNGSELQVLIEALPNLALVIVITIAVFLVLRRFAIPIYLRMGRRAHESGAINTVFLFIGSNLLDVVIVVLAWGLGYLFTVVAVGEFGAIGIRQTMYLNAFLIVELAKVAVRIVLAPNSAGLRPFPIETGPAKSLNRTLSIVISILGYGQLLVVPIINRSASVSAGAGVAALLYLIVLCYLIVVVFRKRAPVAQWISGVTHAEQDPLPEAGITESEAFRTSAPVRKKHGVFAQLWIALANRWHWFALLYLTMMFVLVMTQPNKIVFDAALASGKVIGIIVAASLVTSGLARMKQRGFSLPAEWAEKLPLLEPRMNGFLRRVFGTLRLFIMFVAAIFVLNAVDLVDLAAYAGSPFGVASTKVAVAVGIIIAVAFCIWLAMTSWVDYRLNPEYGAVASNREITLLTLLRNAATITIVVLTLMFVLSEIGLDIGPLLASAGVLGLAVGFGAQSMVQDIITGVFIQFENAMNVGDVVSVNGTTGTVEKLSVRSVSLRDVNGTVHLIPFSSVDMVSNFSRDYAYFVCDMGVAYREDIDDVREAMLLCFDRLKKDKDQGAFVMDDLEWFGLQSFGDSAIVLRARIKTHPGKQFGVGRAFNGYLKTEFDSRNIEIPFPHQTIYFGEAKDGSTQPVTIKSVENTKEPETPKGD